MMGCMVAPMMRQVNTRPQIVDAMHHRDRTAVIRTSKWSYVGNVWANALAAWGRPAPVTKRASLSPP